MEVKTASPGKKVSIDNLKGKLAWQFRIRVKQEKKLSNRKFAFANVASIKLVRRDWAATSPTGAGAHRNWRAIYDVAGSEGKEWIKVA
jgi:hypothetical protein